MILSRIHSLSTFILAILVINNLSNFINDFNIVINFGNADFYKVRTFPMYSRMRYVKHIASLFLVSNNK